MSFQNEIYSFITHSMQGREWKHIFGRDLKPIYIFSYYKKMKNVGL